MNMRAANMNAGCARRFHRAETFQNRRGSRPYLPLLICEGEVIMSDPRSWKSRSVLGAGFAVFTLLPASHALASQGPGGGPGTAGAITQLVMAILVYGASAAIVAAGLVGALRHR
jgi:hypothetical protein